MVYRQPKPCATKRDTLLPILWPSLLEFPSVGGIARVFLQMTCAPIDAAEFLFATGNKTERTKYFGPDVRAIGSIAFAMPFHQIRHFQIQKSLLSHPQKMDTADCFHLRNLRRRCLEILVSIVQRSACRGVFYDFLARTSITLCSVTMGIDERLGKLCGQPTKRHKSDNPDTTADFLRRSIRVG